ncbi:mitochondrial ribosomal protein L37-domain-containing protein [Truncatella angustata]|uniref:Large ribosomal subunit protein mL54 n=1 Tax=Truncatella angustata TaxID=152316 RepID=A0A9P8UX49_9PEZI|nr:mitochondrial ribosomal protein L37-domain-containing protein [Truncatella angustata]KAH6660013.1 mitochondrial ribosomal protein L37-domain-containing protein [Truncatella angustata]
MICRNCLSRASVLTRALPLSQTPQRSIPAVRAFTAAPARRNAAPAAPEATPSSSIASDAPPTFSTPLGDAGPAAEAKPALSTCPGGTILTGLNYLKSKTDPVALADDAYPEWLWSCIDVTVKKTDEDDNNDAAAEFSKSKKQRRLAAKRQRALEARLLAEGNLEALAPKIPLQQQSVNMPGNEEGTPEGALAAVAAREELRKAMRKERKAKIKETNYLKSM